ncbi:protein crumbs homolog 1-like [Protopterus annectens]|uniref:protein crumbs homolog 1-like n=1 Tax=Protopterus annectens TaxID=7888 RepID=UPI001CFA7D7D|nr:protein crumbs homolog 1-like [Protopterus annectens]
MPCLNNGSCTHTDTHKGYSCICPKEPVAFMGEKCEFLYDACSFQPCSNGSTCNSTLGTMNYRCICPPGFSGTDCTVNINECESNPCKDLNAECVDKINEYSCVCHVGFSGLPCQPNEFNCSRELCENNGTCTEINGSSTCKCEAGFRGDRCELDIDECSSYPCQNGAICREGVNHYRCFCVPGFQGYNCEIDINECASKPCKNGGTCLNEMDIYQCICAAGYTGTNCETEINECESDPCQNGGTCFDGTGFYECICSPGFEGLNCETDINECASQPCQNGGICQDETNRYTCNCNDTGFEGKNCEIDILECASDPCVNNATCLEGVKNYTCLCWNGYRGQHCEDDEDECISHPCQNGGTCFERSNQSYYGILPELRKFTYLTAAGYICYCQPGFTGDNCEININECESEPCKHGAICEDLVNAFQCFCQPGYTGVICENDIDECENNPCQNGATCVDHIADYFCKCPQADMNELIWGGKNCTVELIGCQRHHCQNGASCVPTYTEGIHDYTCHCTHGFYGENCSTPTTFSFNSEGYLMLDLPFYDITTPVTDISLRFRTTLQDMVILYCGNESQFLYLELFMGSLHAMLATNETIFDLSLPAGKVSDGQWHKVSLTLGRSFNLTLLNVDCRSRICSISTPLSESTVSLVSTFATVIVGGAAFDSFFNNTRSKLRYTGCLEDLRINFEMVLPHHLTESQNKGMTLGCHKTEWCEKDPCSSKGECIDLWTTFTCKCSRPYEGPACSYEYLPGTFSNENSTGFASFHITNNPGSEFTVSFFIRTLKPDGLVLQIRNMTTSFMSVYLHNGTICSKTHSDFTNSAMYVADGLKHFIQISVFHGLVHFGPLKETNTTNSVIADSIMAGDIIYMGGLPHEFEDDMHGGFFKGCLQDVRVNNHRMVLFPFKDENYSMPHESYSLLNITGVKPSCISDDTCASRPCSNGGTCTVTWNDFNCSCPINFTGKTCNERVWCESNPCPEDSKCQNVPFGYECLANATFNGNNMLQYKFKGPISKTFDSVYMEIRTRDTNCTLLSVMDDVWIGFQNNYLQAKITARNSVESLLLQTTTSLNDGRWHSILVTKDNPSMDLSKWTIKVDGILVYTSPDVAGRLHFSEDSIVQLAEHFSGCFGQVAVGEIILPFIEEHMLSQQEQFIKLSGSPAQKGCSGADVCSPNPCFNSGFCKDLFNDFSCTCRTGWEGRLCNLNIDECNSNPCLHGSCTDLVANYECKCDKGYTGRNCEVNADDCLENQCKNGATCIDDIGAYKCSCTAGFTGSFCEWPFPPVQCGIDVICLNGGTCIGEFWGANCTCLPGFTGERCESNINECDSNPCHNEGTCQDLVNKYKCVCAATFSGPNCDVDKATQASQVPFIAVAVPVVCGCFLVLVIGIIFMVLTARKKRQSEGTYSPSQQEVAGARLEMDSVLKVPPEERLI